MIIDIWLTSEIKNYNNIKKSFAGTFVKNYFFQLIDFFLITLKFTCDNVLTISMFRKVYWIVATVAFAQVIADEDDECLRILAGDSDHIYKLSLLKGTHWLSRAKQEDFKNILSYKVGFQNINETIDSMLRIAPDLNVAKDMKLKCWAKKPTGDMVESEVFCKSSCSTLILCTEEQVKKDIKAWECKYFKICDLKESCCASYEKLLSLISKLTAFECDVLSCNTELCNSEKWNTQLEMAKHFNLDWKVDDNVDEQLKILIEKTKNPQTTDLATVEGKSEIEYENEDENEDYDDEKPYSLATRIKINYLFVVISLLFFDFLSIL